MRLLKEIRNLLGNYHVKSGIYHFYRDEFKQAADFFRKALREDPPLCESDRNTARHYLTMTFVHSAERLEAQEDLPAAVEAYELAAESNPTYADIRYKLGQALESLGEARKAADQYLEATRTRPTYIEAHVALGFSLLGLGETDEASDAFRRALDLKFEKLREPFEIGATALMDGDSAKAKDYFREVFLREPHQFEKHYRAALDLLKSEDYEEALAALEAAAELNPRYPDLPNYLGIALAELDRLEEAMDAFRRAINQIPKAIVPRLNLAFTLAQSGDYKSAEKELEQILNLEPDEPAAKAKLEEIQQGPRPERRRGQSRGASA